MMKELRFGIEIETVGATRETLARAIQSVVGGRAEIMAGRWNVTCADGRVWRVVRDASLSQGEHSGEIVSPILGYGDIEKLQDIVRAVRTAGATTDDSTGIHIHIDGSRFDAKSLVNLIKLVHKQERLLEHALRIRQARLTNYCRPIDPAFMQRIEARRPQTLSQVSVAWYGSSNTHPDRYHHSRYHGLNLNSLFFRGSIELRYFNGTLHAGEVKAYVQLSLALAAKALTAKTASSKRREFNPATAKYDFRVVLLHLGLIGDEFKTARLHLTKHLAGSAAWKGERRERHLAGNAPANEEVSDGRAAA